MTRCLSRCALAVTVVSLAFVLNGCGGLSRIEMPSVDAVAAGKAALKEYDTNGDGKISGEELQKCPALMAFVGNPQGSITAEQITDEINRWQKTKTGLVRYGLKVSKNNKPLEGATVTLIPEKFLGSDFKTASGKSGKTGMANISIPFKDPQYDPQGVAFGFYRVEVTKDGEAIPAQYNTDSKLGVAVTQTMAPVITIPLAY